MPAPRPRRSRTAGRFALGALGVYAAQRRRALRLTQRDLADLAGVSVDTVHAVESGKPSLQVNVLLPVLEALGLALVAVPRSEAERLAARGESAVLALEPSSPSGGSLAPGR